MLGSSSPGASPKPPEDTLEPSPAQDPPKKTKTPAPRGGVLPAQLVALRQRARMGGSFEFATSIAAAEARRLGGISTSAQDTLPGEHNRMLKALQCGLPNEVDWGLNRLLLLSLSAREPWLLATVPGLTEELLRLILKHVDARTHAPPAAAALFAPDAAAAARRERALLALLAIHNFCFARGNALHFAGHGAARQTLLVCVVLPEQSEWVEFRQYAATALEQLAPLLFPSALGLATSSPEAALLETHVRALIPLLFDGLFHSDKHRVVTAGHTLKCLALNDTYKRLLIHPSPRVVQRLHDLLLLEDADIALAVLEVLYQLTGYGYVFVNYLVHNLPAPANLVAVVLRYLRFRMGDAERDVWQYHWHHNDDLNPFAQPPLPRHRRPGCPAAPPPPAVRTIVPPLPDMSLELMGIPLTAGLLLRNLARHASCLQLFQMAQHTLVSFLASPRLNRVVCSILWELSRTQAR